MQSPQTQEQVEYAGLAWRTAAVLIDTVVLFGLLIVAAMVYIVVVAARGHVDLNDPAAVQELSSAFQISNWVANAIVFGGLFVYYTALEAAFGASVGKLALRLRVTALDGSRPSGAAVLVRNLVRLPEAWLLYLPAALSCSISPRRQRLGDHAARTVVVRRGAAPAVRFSGSTTWTPLTPGGTPPPPPVPPAAAPAAAAPDLPVTAGPDSLAAAMGALKTAALAVRGAHLNYLRFSELELSSPQPPDDEGGETYSREYVSAWFTLADAVAALQEARSAAVGAATAAGQTLDAACAAQPDLLHLLGELRPYLESSSDDELHDAYLSVARGDAAATA